MTTLQELIVGAGLMLCTQPQKLAQRFSCTNERSEINQEIVEMKVSKMPQYPSTRVVIGAGATVKLRSDSVDGQETLTIQLLNEGANALTGFEIRASVGDMTPVVVKSSAFATPDSICYYASADPVTLGSGAGCLLKLDASEVDKIEIYATSTSGTTILSDAAGYSYSS
jgi:hypothetical protein